MPGEAGASLSFGSRGGNGCGRSGSGLLRGGARVGGKESEGRAGVHRGSSSFCQRSERWRKNGARSCCMAKGGLGGLARSGYSDQKLGNSMTEFERRASDGENCEAKFSDWLSRLSFDWSKFTPMHS